MAEITILAKNVKPNETMVLYNDWCINLMFTFSEDNSYRTAINIFKNIRQIEFKFHNGPSIYTQSPNKIFVGIYQLELKFNAQLRTKNSFITLGPCPLDYELMIVDCFYNLEE